jgi:hypothetical protein
MTLRARMLTHIAAGLACTSGFCWAQADGLTHDPFARPAFLKATPPPAAQARNNVGRGALPEPVWQPALTAVMMAGPKSLVNVDGTILRIGEAINGHQLVEVHEETAVFVRNRKRVTLTLRGMELGAEVASPRKDNRATTGRPDAPLKQDSPPKSVDRGTAERRD